MVRDTGRAYEVQCTFRRKDKGEGSHSDGEKGGGWQRGRHSNFESDNYEE